MKSNQKVLKCFLFILAILCDFDTPLMAQAPQGFPYQAVARTAAGNLMTNQSIQMRFSISDSSAAGTILYQETQTVITNSLGLFTHTIGQGAIILGSFNAINWGLHVKFLKVEMDTTGASNFVVMGSTQLMSVPYALFASGTSNASVKNGLSKTGDSISLGGHLTENTNIDLDEHDFSIRNTAGSNTLSISQSNAVNIFALSQVPISQTFTAITTDKVASIELYLSCIAFTSVTINLSNSNGDVLGTEVRSFAGPVSNWFTFVLGAHPLLQQGQVYTLSFTGSNGTALYYDPSNPYAGGSSGFSSMHDFAFNVYIQSNLPVLSTVNQNVGIGISSPSARLDVNGQIKISGGAPGIGKVLTSDAMGLASWQLPVSDSKWTYNGSDIYNVNAGNVRIGSYPSYISPVPWKLHVAGYDNAIKITGTGPYEEFGQINFGDVNYVYLKEDQDDKLYLNANRFAFMAGNVGINTINPLAGLHVENRNVLFSSPAALPVNPGNPPLLGTGSYMMWYADKAAFRSGSISGTEWSLANVGLNSLAAGNHCIAKGISSIALGNTNIAEGDWSFVAGSNNQSIGFNSTAMGNSTRANGNYSTSFGNGTQANSLGTTAMGISNVANGYGCTVIGVYNDSIMATQLGLTSTTPLFIIGNGSNSVSRANALVVRNNGRVGIGNNATTYQLELSTNSAAKPSSSTWTITSDARLKSIDGKYTRGLSDIIKLNTVLYHYKKGNERNLPSEEQSYGFIAQEVQKVFPECVTQQDDGYLSLDLHPLLVSYVNAFKELNEKLEQQSFQMRDLQIEIAQLKESIKK